VAAVVPTGSAPPEEAWLQRLQARARESLADYKQPRQLLILPELPRNALGKVLKPALRTMAERAR
jgi:acyl-coenzyme A synthetase/AMP-(fatty) acid ligase